MSTIRHFEALVDVADEEEPAFRATVAVTEASLSIVALDIEIARWAVSDISVALSEDGVLIDVPGSLLCVRTDDDASLADCLEHGSDAHIGAA